MVYFHLNDTKIWNIFVFSPLTGGVGGGGISPSCGGECMGGGGGRGLDPSPWRNPCIDVNFKFHSILCICGGSLTTSNTENDSKFKIDNNDIFISNSNRRSAVAYSEHPV